MAAALSVLTRSPRITSRKSSTPQKEQIQKPILADQLHTYSRKGRERLLSKGYRQKYLDRGNFVRDVCSHYSGYSLHHRKWKHQTQMLRRHVRSNLHCNRDLTVTRETSRFGPSIIGEWLKQLAQAIGLSKFVMAESSESRIVGVAHGLSVQEPTDSAE